MLCIIDPKQMSLQPRQVDFDSLWDSFKKELDYIFLKDQIKPVNAMILYK